jgi:hypothetical protein
MDQLGRLPLRGPSIDKFDFFIPVKLYYEPVKLNRNEVGSSESYPLRRTDGRFSRADCLLGCSARCGGCICPSVRAAAAVASLLVPTSAAQAAVDSECSLPEENSNRDLGSESAVVWISSVCSTTCEKPASHRHNEPRIASFALGLSAKLSRSQPPVTIFAKTWAGSGSMDQLGRLPLRTRVLNR